MAGPLIRIARVDGRGGSFLLHQIDEKRVMATGRYKVLERGMEIMREDGTPASGVAQSNPAPHAGPKPAPSRADAPQKKLLFQPTKPPEDEE